MSNVFPLLFKKIDTDLVNRFLEFCICDTYTITEKRSPTGYGKIKNSVLPAKEHFLTEDNEKKMVNVTGKRPVGFRTLLLNYHYSNVYSEDMINMVFTLWALKKEKNFKAPAVKALLDYLWGKSKYYHYAMAYLYTAQMAILTVYIGLNQFNLGLEIPFFALAILFLFIEIR